MQNVIEMLASKSPFIISEGMELLSKAVFSDKAAKTQAGKDGALELIVSAIQQYSDSSSMQEDAYRVLRSLVFQSAFNMQLSTQIFKGKLVSIIFGGMKKHYKNSEVQAEGLWLLMVLCSKSEFHANAAHNTMEIIVQTLERFKHDNRIKKKAMYLIALLKDA